MFRWVPTLLVVASVSVCAGVEFPVAAETAEFRLGTFSADITVPLGHRCMGILPTKSEVIVDPLQIHGFVLLGPDKPIVLAALDWCEVRNDSYDRWRGALADAAGTTAERVLVSSVHQHDAPVIDEGAQTLLTNVGLKNELFDVDFHDTCLQRVSQAVRDCIAAAQPVTHFGLGQAVVDRIASNRRVVYADGRVTFDRGSGSGGDAFHAAAPEGLIDPLLRTISFWNQDRPLLAVSHYAVHPMSHYGKGGVSYDFVGMARERRRSESGVPQIYATGCSGDTTAGKYNDGSPARRAELADRLCQAMRSAWEATARHPLRTCEFRKTEFTLPFHTGSEFTVEALNATLHDEAAPVSERILAAMGLSSRHRLAEGHAIDLPCVDLGQAQIVVLPGESFVGLQLMAQQLRPDLMVMAIGFGECWPGYTPTESAFDDGFGHGWRWVDRGSEAAIRAALRIVQQAPSPADKQAGR